MCSLIRFVIDLVQLYAETTVYAQSAAIDALCLGEGL